MKADMYDLVIYWLAAISRKEYFLLKYFYHFSLRDKVHFYVFVDICGNYFLIFNNKMLTVVKSL